jgi:predicted enzyme related to lactoylglutathione lyase
MPFVLGDYIEIPAIDLDDAKAFYDTLFGWEYDTDHSGL